MTISFAVAGTVTVSAGDKVLMSFECEAGDIWRLARTKDIPIRDWVRLTVERTRLEGIPAIFWLDENRAHDAELIKKVNEYLKDHDTDASCCCWNGSRCWWLLPYPNDEMPSKAMRPSATLNSIIDGI